MKRIGDKRRRWDGRVCLTWQLQPYDSLGSAVNGEIYMRTRSIEFEGRENWQEYEWLSSK